MLVHVKKVEIFGFKSFGFKNTTVQFEPGLVSISGPNGSGKSNILDAIIFAMGENKPKVMRVDKLRSLIHDIDGNRRGPKMARSSVHFDNTDRKIPVDSDTVEITREMDDNGENTYYFNRKKTNRSHILDLLSLANAGLGQLNAVQQGTVTRISEMSSDEKRISIETMLGLSFFDEKKTEALKQLDEADRRLEIALVQMGNMRKRIDELEEERNQKLRHDLIDRELGRYRAIDAANKLKAVLGQKSSKEQSLRAVAADIAKLGQEKAALCTEIDGLESERSELMAQANNYSRAKSALDLELSDAMKEYETEKTAISASSKRIEQIESRLPEIKSELQEIGSRRAGILSQIKEAEKSLGSVNARKNRVKDGLAMVDSRRKKTLDEQSQAAAKQSETDQKIKLLTDQLNAAKLKLAKVQNEKEDAEDKIRSNSAKLGELKQDLATMASLKHQLGTMMKNHRDTVSELKARLENLNSRKSRTADDIEESVLLLEKTSKAANQYESKIKTIKGFMHEDYTVAKLKEDAEKLGILGLVYEMITWDKKYERPVLAVSSDWLKAIVVNDFATLLAVAEFARSKNLPKLKIIPVEAIPKFRLDLPKIPGVMGVLSDYVQCDFRYLELKTFLFGNIVLADSKESAYGISRAGYKSVTLDGEFFEARGGTVVIDINSKISKLTKLISMSTHIDGLFSSIGSLKKYMSKKKASLKKLESSIHGNAQRLSISEKSLVSASEQHSLLESRISSAQSTKEQLGTRIAGLSERSSRLAAELSRCESHIDSVASRIGIVEENYAGGQQARIARELAQVNTQKTEMEQQFTGIMNEYRDISSRLADLHAGDKRQDSYAIGLRNEELSLSGQKDELESEIRAHENAKQLKHEALVKLRQKEQDLISSGGSSIGQIKDYDDRLRDLAGQDRGLAGKINSLQRQSDSLGRDLRDLAENEAKLQQLVLAFGFGQDMETFDVGSIVQGLSAELQSLNELNAKAPESYLVTADGYSSWSTRKNSLEEERNSIVRFIEGIDKDKRQSFLDAFDRVDKEIRLIFSKMTGGNAWLELQNEDDIFSSGISYLIQFPNKPKRESTSLSGGEKTLAAIVFVLALQKLKPSPFYLFDEIDAHLDAPNSERLAKILEERARESQFIMVSLKDSVVQKARLIYGVYPKNGVSNVVTYKDRKNAIRASPS